MSRSTASSRFPSAQPPFIASQRSSPVARPASTARHWMWLSHCRLHMAAGVRQDDWPPMVPCLCATISPRPTLPATGNVNAPMCVTAWNPDHLSWRAAWRNPADSDVRHRGAKNRLLWSLDGSPSGQRTGWTGCNNTRFGSSTWPARARCASRAPMPMPAPCCYGCGRRRIFNRAGSACPDVPPAGWPLPGTSHRSKAVYRSP